MHASPWAVPLYVMPECVIAAISWGRRVDDVVPVLLGLAARRGLTTYDPQRRVIRTFPSGSQL